MSEGLDLYGPIVVQNRLYFNRDNQDAETTYWPLNFKGAQIYATVRRGLSNHRRSLLFQRQT